MHERNDETLDRAAHGRSAYGTYDSVLGLDRYVADLATASGRYSVLFEGRDGVRAVIRHPDPFFRALERAWNEHPGLGERDVHACFWGLTEPEIRGGFDFAERVALISGFLTLAATAVELLANGQHPEVASLEEHARHYGSKNNSFSKREVL